MTDEPRTVVWLISPPARLLPDGSVVLRRDVARRYGEAMGAAIRQAQARHPEGRVPADIEQAQRLLARAGSANGTELAPVARTEGASSRPGMVTVRVAGERLSISARAVRKAIGAGRIPATRVGRDWSISEDDLDKFAAERRNA
jgi:excisionase family DNA binding protein